jgi:hypothetical protein
MSFGRMLKSAWNMLDTGFQAGEKGMDAVYKTAVAVDNVAEVAVIKTDHYKSRARLETKSDYIMDLIEMYKADPDLGEFYISDPENLPEGVTADDIRKALKDTGSSNTKPTTNSSNSSTEADALDGSGY